jgi:sugar/nucleoside kinase (ribokinase family)
LGIGAVAVDDLIYLDRFPEPGSKRHIIGERRQGGGLVGTALVAAARLGVKAAYMGVLGEDALSRYTIAELEAEGVDCGAVRRNPDARPYHSTILVDGLTAERTILASAEGVTPPDPDEMTPELIATSRVLLIDHTVSAAALRAAEIANHLGIPVVADLERFGESAAAPALIARIDHLIVGTGFAEAAVGAAHPAEAARRLARPGQAACAVTAGAQGCWYVVGGSSEAFHQPACRVQVVDTTGCGDVFHGAYAAALVRGCDIATAISVATVAAGIKATQPGGRAGIPNWAAVQRYLAENPFGRG